MENRASCTALLCAAAFEVTTGDRLVPELEVVPDASTPVMPATAYTRQLMFWLLLVVIVTESILGLSAVLMLDEVNTNRLVAGALPFCTVLLRV